MDSTKVTGPEIKNPDVGTSLAVQWLRICFAMQGIWVWSLVVELRSHIRPVDLNWAAKGHAVLLLWQKYSLPLSLLTLSIHVSPSYFWLPLITHEYQQQHPHHPLLGATETSSSIAVIFNLGFSSSSYLIDVSYIHLIFFPYQPSLSSEVLWPTQTDLQDAIVKFIEIVVSQFLNTVMIKKWIL